MIFGFNKEDGKLCNVRCFYYWDLEVVKYFKDDK